MMDSITTYGADAVGSTTTTKTSLTFTNCEEAVSVIGHLIRQEAISFDIIQQSLEVIRSKGNNNGQLVEKEHRTSSSSIKRDDVNKDGDTDRTTETSRTSTKVKQRNDTDGNVVVLYPDGTHEVTTKKKEHEKVKHAQQTGLSHTSSNVSTTTKKDDDDTQSNKPTTTQQQQTATKKKNNKKQSLMKQCRYRHIALRFMYDGSHYNGFAESVGNPKDNSVEKELFAALTKTCLIPELDNENEEGGNVTVHMNNDETNSTKDEDTAGNNPDVDGNAGSSNGSGRYRQCHYSRCGRTDRGVSAFGQVIGIKVRSKIPLYAMDGSTKESIQDTNLPRNSFESIKVNMPTNKSSHDNNNSSNGRKQKKRRKQNDSNKNMEATTTLLNEMDYCKILNGVLPCTIRCLGWTPVSTKFSARFSTKDRTYRYFFVRRTLDIHAMQQGLNHLIGKHDFRNLCKMDTEAVTNFVRVINYAKIVVPQHSQQQERNVCYFEICGQAFLWHMIRCIVSVCFMIGKGYEDPSIVSELLNIDQNPAKPSYMMAPDLPLVLHGCNYGKQVTFGYNTKNIWDVHNLLEDQWQTMILQAERLHNAITSLQEEVFLHQDEFFNFLRDTIIPSIVGGGTGRRTRAIKHHTQEVETALSKALDEASDDKLRSILAEVRHDEKAKEQVTQEPQLTTDDHSKDGVGDNNSNNNNEDTNAIPEKTDGRDAFSMEVEPSRDIDQDHSSTCTVIRWSEAITMMKRMEYYKLVEPNCKSSSYHVKLLDRSKGTTYEEKVLAMKGKKRQRYEANISKQQTPEADQQFYQQMLQQGGHGM